MPAQHRKHSDEAGGMAGELNQFFHVAGGQSPKLSGLISTASSRLVRVWNPGGPVILQSNLLTNN
jgi:hypothetical protein